MSHSGDQGADEGGDDDRRLRWRSRRGMLEVELALSPFVEQQLPTLSPADRARYERLLEHDDVDIYEWVQGRAEPADADLVGIVAAIRDAARA